MQDTLVNEPVGVWAFFDHEMHPVAMNWRKRIVKFDKLILVTQKRVGETKLINLICASDTANYELEFNNETHLWKLKKVMPKE